MTSVKSGKDEYCGVFSRGGPVVEAEVVAAMDPVDIRCRFDEPLVSVFSSLCCFHLPKVVPQGLDIRARIRVISVFGERNGNCRALYDLRILNLLSHRGSVFQHDSLVGYTQLVLDEARDQVLVGGRDALFRLSMDDLRVLEQTEWQSSQKALSNCESTGVGLSEDLCHNFVRVLLLHNEDEVFTCGTNAFSPNCTWRPAERLSEVSRVIDGKAICPYDPRHNTTALMTSNGELYTATIIDILARDPSINRNLGTAPSLRTEQMNSKWLNEPNFVSTYEFGNFVYFFFREIAVEFINCGKRVYSRVARVCKTDRGGSILLEGKWTSFVKARLNCSLPGNFPFYFDELQSTFYSEDEELVYAIFSTPPNSIAGSAVCAFNMSAFETAFNGPFKHQKDSMSAWMRHENGGSETRVSTLNAPEKSANHLVMAQKYQLMDEAVQPRSLHPMITREHERWTHIVVDHVAGKTELIDVFFLATEDGKIQKMIRLPAPSSPTSPASSASPPSSPSHVTCLVETIKIVPNGHPRPVKAMKLSSRKGAILLSTNGNVLKVPVQRCARFTDSKMCIGARDPYCGWDNLRQKCTPAPGGNPHTEFWEQDISGCPNMEYSEDGDWSPWSSWSKCQQVGGDPMVDQCLCRSRSCDNPEPTNGGRPCAGASIEVANCTIHGQWTEWSEWSACSQTCGYGIRSRKRQCGNPPPQYGGRLCVGQDTDKQYCDKNPDCPLPPVDGSWSMWSGWSGCTKDCNGGIQTRRRACDRPRPMREGKMCAGNKQEWRMCNTQECDEIARISPWTEWIQTNRTSGGYFEQRFRFTCRANVPKRKMIKTSYAKSQARFCHNNGHGCRTADTSEELAALDEDGGWSPWAEWSDCSEDCGGGMQWRNRTCDEPAPSGYGADCDGHQREGRQCNTHSCEGTWSCWSPYSPCSVTCGQGVMTRSRQCERSKVDQNYTIPCTGDAEEMKTCKMADCLANDPCDNDEWSPWSPCGGAGSGVQYRHRIILNRASKNALGDGVICPQHVDIRPCDPVVFKDDRGSSPDINVAPVKAGGPEVAASHQEDVRRLGVIYLVIVGVISFILGGVACEALWSTNVPFSDNLATLPKLNNVAGSQDSLEMRMLNNLSEMSQYDAFGSLRKGKVTVNEASTLQRNSMWTNLSINDL
ncbi:hypothetical protein BaRGS_00016071 [Batillaria attramentaria]|uniref:Semaphorin-2A n=1 Tax=Batillaria attramentaria TaxID=370345 RepID=A0ABD0L073_9CAEN